MEINTNMANQAQEQKKELKEKVASVKNQIAQERAKFKQDVTSEMEALRKGTSIDEATQQRLAEVDQASLEKIHAASIKLDEIQEQETALMNVIAQREQDLSKIREELEKCVATEQASHEAQTQKEQELQKLSAEIERQRTLLDQLNKKRDAASISEISFDNLDFFDATQTVDSRPTSTPDVQSLFDPPPSKQREKEEKRQQETPLPLTNPSPTHPSSRHARTKGHPSSDQTLYPVNRDKPQTRREAHTRARTDIFNIGNTTTRESLSPRKREKHVGTSGTVVSRMVANLTASEMNQEKGAATRHKTIQTKTAVQGGAQDIFASGTVNTLLQSSTQNPQTKSLTQTEITTRRTLDPIGDNRGTPFPASRNEEEKPNTLSFPATNRTETVEKENQQEEMIQFTTAELERFHNPEKIASEKDPVIQETVTETDTTKSKTPLTAEQARANPPPPPKMKTTDTEQKPPTVAHTPLDETRGELQEEKEPLSIEDKNTVALRKATTFRDEWFLTDLSFDSCEKNTMTAGFVVTATKASLDDLRQTVEEIKTEVKAITEIPLAEDGQAERISALSKKCAKMKDHLSAIVTGRGTNLKVKIADFFKATATKVT